MSPYTTSPPEDKPRTATAPLARLAALVHVHFNAVLISGYLACVCLLALGTRLPFKVLTLLLASLLVGLLAGAHQDLPPRRLLLLVAIIALAPALLTVSVLVEIFGS